MPNNQSEECVNFLSQHAVPKEMTLAEIETATRDDATLQRVILNIRNKNW